MNVHVLLFLVYSFFGWVVEVVFHVLRKRRFVNRGFLKGPVCPIYGTGALLVILTVEPFRDDLLLFTLGAFLVPLLLEFLVGVLLHRIFRTRWWTYSHRRYQYRGYVSLLSTSLWGALAFVFIRFFHPAFLRALMDYPENDVRMAAVIAFSLFTIDIVFTIYKLMDFKASLETVRREREALDRLPPYHALRVEKAAQYENHIGQLVRRQKRFFLSYPELSSNRFRDVLTDIRSAIQKPMGTRIQTKK